MPGPAGPSPKLLGRIAAVVMACVFGGVIWWAMSRNTTPSTATPAPIDEEVPDILDLIPGQGESIVITLADQNDPTRVAGIIEVDRFDPIGNGERELINPRGWLYPKDGRVVRVRADRGVLAMPSANSTPESGTLEGDVRVLVYEESPAPGVPPEEDAQPMVTATFDQPVRFETRYLRLSTPGAFKIESEQITFDGVGLGVMLNSVRDRLELIDVDSGGRLEIRAAQRSEDSVAGEAGVTQTDPTPPAIAANQAVERAPVDGTSTVDTTLPASPKIDLYRAVMRAEVVAQMGTSRLEGDRLELFARLRDNTLADDAFTPVVFRRSEPTMTPDPSPEPAGNSDQTPPAPTATTTPGPVTRDGAPLVLTWQGPMSIRPLADDASPAELAGDEAAIALFAEEGSRVRFRDDARGLEGEAASIRYAATRAVFSMERGERPVETAIADAGLAKFDRVDADLRTGRIAFGGAGFAETDTGASLEWNDSGELRLALDGNGDLTDRLTHASFVGGVVADQRDGVIESERLETRFGVGRDGRAALRSATITAGQLSANPDEQGRPRSLSGALIRVDFTGDADAPRPVRVEALGDSETRAHAQAEGSSLLADRAVATLDQDERGELFVRAADASGSIAFSGENDTRASGGAMRLDGLSEQIRITGQGSQIAQGDSTIEGMDIRLDAQNRRMDVEGSGRFTHTLRNDDGVDTGRVLATWQRSMRFDDALGRLVCEGGVSLTAARDAFSRDKLDAERVEVEMTPRLSPNRLGQTQRSRREVKVARAFGGTRGDAYVPASAETQRYDRGNPEVADGLLFIEGDQIIADAARSELRVPGAGTLLVLDRRADDNSPDAGPAIGPGLTRFTWEGALRLDRVAGVGVMTDSVFVRHKAVGNPGDNALSDLLCDTLTARFTESNPSGDAGEGGTLALDSADAQGNVVFVSGGKRLDADGARFDASREVLDALALPGRLVTLTEPGRAAPVSARSIRWDLRSDQIEINKPSPVVLPSE